MRFREEHAALVEAINSHTVSTNLQTRLLEELCQEVKLMNEKVDRLYTHAVRLENIEVDVSSIANTFQGVAEKRDVVSSHVSSLNERADDIRPVFDDKIKPVKMFGAAFSGTNLKSFDGGLCQSPQGVDGQDESLNHLRQHG